MAKEKIEINIFDEAESTVYVQQRIEDIVNSLSAQFVDKTDCFRELIQNSIDAETPQIDVTFDTNTIGDLVQATITFEDYGIGMTMFERDEYLLKLFKSSKESRSDKIGKYGIGIVSPFILKPDHFIIESTGKNGSTVSESWGLHMRQTNGNPEFRHYEIEQRKGTKVVIQKIVSMQEAVALKSQVKEKISFFCARSRTPIYVDGEFINKEFKLNSNLQVHEVMPGLEYVIGQRDSGGDPIYEYLNNRLKLEQGIKPFTHWPNISLLVSSSEFHHTFSRDKVVEDDAFARIINHINTAGIDKLLIKALDIIESYQQVSANVVKFDKAVKSNDAAADDSARYSKLDYIDAWGLVGDYIQDLKGKYKPSKKEKPSDLYVFIKKGMPKACSRYKLFQTFFGEKLSIDDVLNTMINDSKLYTVSTLDKEMANILKKHGKVAFVNYIIYDYTDSCLTENRRVLGMLGTFEDARVDFYSRCEIKDKNRITSREKDFMSMISGYLKKNGSMCYNEVYFTSNSDIAQIDAFKDFVIISKDGRKAGKKKTNFFRMDQYGFFSRVYDIAVNIDSPKIQQLMTIYMLSNKKKLVCEMLSELEKNYTYLRY